MIEYTRFKKHSSRRIYSVSESRYVTLKELWYRWFVKKENIIVLNGKEENITAQVLSSAFSAFFVDHDHDLYYVLQEIRGLDGPWSTRMTDGPIVSPK